MKRKTKNEKQLNGKHKLKRKKLNEKVSNGKHKIKVFSPG
jgi:hypothetical protein